MAKRSEGAIALVLGALMVLPVGVLLGGPAGGLEVTLFADGSDAILVDVVPPGVVAKEMLALEEYSYVVNATMKVSTHAKGDMRGIDDLKLDVDGDGSFEWAFNSTGAGAFGRQTQISNGSRTAVLDFNAPGNRTFTIRLPRGANVLNATMNATGRLEDIQFNTVRLPGNTTNGYFGMSVAGGVDINRDGYDDVLVGCPNGASRGLVSNGFVNLYLGGKGGPDGLPADSLSGGDNGDAFGFSVAGVQDFTGDGYGEVLAGAPLAEQKLSVIKDTGAAYLYSYDSATHRFRTLPKPIMWGASEGGNMGYSVAEVPDFDSDGRMDIAAGEIMANKSQFDPYLGRVTFLKSGDASLNPVYLWGEAAYSFFGTFITSSRDLDGDQKPDYIIGARFNTPGNRLVGSVYIFNSRQTIDNPVVIAGPQDRDFFGTSGCTGDFNGDGHVDLAVGAPEMKFGVEDRPFGAVFIYLGGPKGIEPGQKPVVLQGRQNGTQYGYAVACPGDVDADGTDDLLIATPGPIALSAGFPGMVDLVLTGRNTTITLKGETPDEHFGLGLAAAGDIDRDGLRDFIVGAPVAPVGPINGAGRANIYMTKLFGPINPTLNIGGRGANDWSWPGIFVRDARLPDLSKKFNGILSNPMPVVTDGFGNEFVDIPVVVYNDRPGTVVISNISIIYNWTATVDVNPNKETGNLTWALNLLLEHKQMDPPFRLVPLVFNASTAGSIKVHGLSVLVDQAPVAKPPFSVELPEDGSDAYLVDLYTVFADDFQSDADLTFWVEGWTNDTIVAVDITDWRWLSVDAFNGSANDNWTGEVRIEVSAMDDAWLDGYTNITVNVFPVNDAPAISGLPSDTAAAGALYTYQPAAADAENDTLSFGLAGGPAGMAVDAVSGLVRWTPNAEQYNKSFDVVLYTSDGRLCATQSFRIVVSSRLAGVAIAGIPPATAVAGEVYSYRPNVTTDVAGATVTLTLQQAPAGLAIQPDGSLRWVPSAAQLGAAPVTLVASDGYFTATRSWTIRVFPSGTPPSGLACAIQEPSDGKKVSGKLTVMGSANITLGSIMRIELGVDGKSWKAAAGTSSWSYMLDTASLPNGRHTILARAWDGQSYSLNASVTIEVDNPPVSAGASGWLLPLLVMIIVIAAVATGAAAYMRRARPAGQATAAAPSAPAVPPAPAAAARTGEELAVEDVFLIHLDGRLIHHATRRLATGVDSDILSSMLTAVTSFVKDALARTGEGQLGSLEYGDNKIIMERGKSCFLAVVITGRQEPPELREEMRQALRNVESEYGSALSSWDGNTATLGGVKKFLGPVTAFTLAAAPVEAPKPSGVDVSLAGELEFYQGYVRLKVAVKNSSPSFIMDCALRVMYNDKALRLDHLEPEYPTQGREIMLGNIGIREKKTVALYLDPQICMESHIEGTLTFKDAQGEMHHADMKRKLASVVCPIMHTDENINIPMLRRMLEGELDQKDSKVFNLPTSLGPEQAFELCKRAVQGHDIRLVREFADERPFVGEAWYFGKVKGRQDKLVVKTAVRADTGSAEFYVASNSRLVVTGLLAELKNDLNKEYKNEKGAETQMEAMADEGRRQRVRTAGSLLDKYGQGEQAPGTTRPPEPGR